MKNNPGTRSISWAELKRQIKASGMKDETRIFAIHPMEGDIAVYSNKEGGVYLHLVHLDAGEKQNERASTTTDKD